MSNCTHGELVDWLEKNLRNEKTYRDLEESPEFQADVAKGKKVQEFFAYPGLPVDLLLVRRKKESVDEINKPKGKRMRFLNHYTLYFAISSGECFEKERNWGYLKKRLLFYQFYLSSITEPRLVEVVVIIPYIEVSDGKVAFFRKYGFGLSKVDPVGNKTEEICQPKSLRARMIEEFKLATDSKDYLRETIQKIGRKENVSDIDVFQKTFKEDQVAEDFARFFDQYILDAIDAVGGIAPGEFGERHIDRRLLSLMFKLKNVSYRKRLQELVNEQLDENDNDYVFVSEVFQELWKENVGIPYSKFLEIFEPALLHVFAESKERQDRYYRDHYIHQFQVFLLGIYIIDLLYESFKKCQCRKPEISWLIASSFHDMAYPVQLYDDWCTKFFRDVFKVDVELANLELKTTFVDQSFLSCVAHIVYALCCMHEGKPDDNWLIDKYDLVQFFYEEITKQKKHCVLSSLSLLKMVQTLADDEKNRILKAISDGDGNFGDIMQEVFIPSAVAIALHDEKVWQRLRKGNGEVNSLEILENMEFTKNPLSFLLILCDCIQEWGRPSLTTDGKRSQKEKRFILREILADPPTSICINMCTPRHLKTRKFFKDKLRELNSIQNFLQQPQGTKFTVRLEDKKHEGEDFEMKGVGSLAPEHSPKIN